MMSQIWTLQWLLGLVLAGATVAYILLTRTKGRDLLGCARKASTSRTPPRSLSPEKKQSASQCATIADYSNVLPASRREFMLAMNTEIPKTASKQISEEYLLIHLLPMTCHYEDAEDGLYTPTGFSIKEIKEMGDFPDYAALSGVPLPNVYSKFNIETALARPYRPFRWNYHQTMSLKKLETDWWIELENTYKQRMNQRKELYAKYGKDILDWMPGSELACKELMEMVLLFICARYPQYFSIRDGRMLENKILETVQDIRAKHPLEILMDNVPEDFAITMRDDKTGFYVFRAGVICSSLGWNVGTKIGLHLHEIHGPVPDYKEKMRFSMDRFFTKMPVDKPIQRGSWGLEVGQPLYMPADDPYELLRLSQKPDLALKDCFLRVDWQTLRRLPISGGIVFNFKALFTPVEEFKDEPKVPALIAKVLRGGKENLMKYKNTWHVEHVVLPALDEWNQEQENSGMIEKNWEVTTLDEDPWYKGWKEKWHRQQGF